MTPIKSSAPIRNRLKRIHCAMTGHLWAYETHPVDFSQTLRVACLRCGSDVRIFIRDDAVITWVGVSK